MDFRTISLGLPFYFASAIKFARVWYERRRHSCRRCAGLSLHRRPCARLDSRRKPSLYAKTTPQVRISFHRPVFLRVRPGCRVIVWHKNFTKDECGPLGSKRLSITGSNVAQHWPHSKYLCHFRPACCSRSSPEHRGQAVARTHSSLICASRAAQEVSEQEAPAVSFSVGQRCRCPRGSAARFRSFALGWPQAVPGSSLPAARDSRFPL